MILKRANVKPEEKLGWYYRYWKSMNLDYENTKTYTFEDWNSFMERDPVL